MTDNLISIISTLVTLCVGLFAIYLYLKERNDRKRDVAKLILQEIRCAEQKMRKYRDILQYNFYDNLLPTNTWKDNIHLFVKDLTENQLDLINDFYSKAIYIGNIIQKIDQEKINLIRRQEDLMNNSEQDLFKPVVPKNKALKLLSVNDQLQKDLRTVSMTTEFIHNTPLGEKLIEISIKKRWYEII